MKALMALLLVVTPHTLDLPPEGVYAGAEATAPAERLDPPIVVVEEVAPPTFTSAIADGRCVGAGELLEAYSPGWDVARMERIMHRESRCQPGARNRSSSATGLLQILASHCPWLAGRLGTWCTRDRLTDPDFNIRAAAALWREQRYGAWAL